ncbi:hypothetical protein [Streptomyces chartreusis]|uniref:hypothetical protein n=1 Tax=Streptomyces chartreusis TaxID=1969 RepID=UPI0033D5936C
MYNDVDAAWEYLTGAWDEETVDFGDFLADSAFDIVRAEAGGFIEFFEARVEQEGFASRPAHDTPAEYRWSLMQLFITVCGEYSGEDPPAPTIDHVTDALASFVTAGDVSSEEIAVLEEHVDFTYEDGNGLPFP